MAQAMERLLATPKTIPSFPASDDIKQLLLAALRMRPTCLVIKFSGDQVLRWVCARGGPRANCHPLMTGGYFFNRSQIMPASPASNSPLTAQVPLCECRGKN